eukprot:snap_masked-scaffold_1-processed-gene-6.31-mRNA-1 protein AED:1.00 eAED:1.00 QI:0/0/0/0/1/1/2/0/317
MNEAVKVDKETNTVYLFPVSKKTCIIATFLWSLLCLTCFCILLYLDLEVEFNWASEWDRRWRRVSYCEEQKQDGLLAQRFNSVSNFGFIYFGGIIFALQIADAFSRDENLISNEITKGWFYGSLFGLGLIFLGIGSFIFHAHPSKETHKYDQASMLVYVTLLLMYFMQLLFQKSFAFNLLFKGMTSICFGVILLYVYHPDLGIEIGLLKILEPLVSGIFILAVVNFTVRSERIAVFLRKETNLGKFIQTDTELDYRILFGVGLCFLLAMFFQEDFVNMPCYSHSKFQFHAAWHGLASLGLETYKCTEKVVYGLFKMY